MAAATQKASQAPSTAGRPTTKPPTRKNPPPTAAAKRVPNAASQRTTKSAQPVRAKAASVAGESPVNGVTSAYSIMASRIANRVAEMAESITFVERPKPKEPDFDPDTRSRRPPRKLEMRLPGSGADAVAFSAPFLDNTLQKMLALQNRMLGSTADLSRIEGVDEKVVREHAAQSAELSRIIALICAEKARQGA